MLAVPHVYPVVVELKTAGRSAPLLSGVLGELVSVGKTHVTESGSQRVQVHVAARDEATARRRVASVVEGKIIEVGDPSPLQHYASQKALPYRRSFVYGRTKPGRFNVQGGGGAHAKASAPAHPDTSPPSTGVGMSVGEALDELLGESPVTEATASQRAARDKRRARWRAQNPALARKMALIAKRTARKRVGKMKGKRKRSAMLAQRHKGKYDPNFESLREAAVSKQDLAVGAALNWLKTRDSGEPKTGDDANYDAQDFWFNSKLAQSAFRGPSAYRKFGDAVQKAFESGPSESLREAESPQDEAVNAALAYLKKRGHISNGSQANSASQDFWFNNRQAQAAFPGKGGYKKLGDAVQKAFESGQSESLREEFKPVGKAQQLLWAALVQRTQYDVRNGIAIGERKHMLTDLARGAEFRGIHFGLIQKAAADMARKGAVIYDGTHTIRMQPMAEGYNTDDFEPNGRLLKKPNIFKATIRECDTCGKEALIKEGTDTCSVCQRKGTKKESVQLNPVDKLVAGYELATYFHENFRQLPAEWFIQDRNRRIVVDAIDRVRQSEGYIPAEALEDAYLHGNPGSRPSIEESPVALTGPGRHEVRVRFGSEQERDFAVRSIMQYTEDCECADRDEFEKDEAVFTMTGSSQQVAEDLVEAVLPRMNLRRNVIVSG